MGAFMLVLAGFYYRQVHRHPRYPWPLGTAICIGLASPFIGWACPTDKDTLTEQIQ